MRIRPAFAGAFLVLSLLAAYAGLSSLQLGDIINDKVLHFLTFFILTIIFYWILDTNRRRILNFTIIFCTVFLGVGSEFLQGFLPNGREFDTYDIVANVVGSLIAAALCSWYHSRMLERKRQRRHYNAVPGEDVEDVELGDGIGHQEEGIISTNTNTNERTMTVEEEVDNWDENAVDAWDEEDEAGASNGNSGVATVDNKKRVD